jgi:hypothetical protein
MSQMLIDKVAVLLTANETRLRSALGISNLSEVGMELMKQS